MSFFSTILFRPDARAPCSFPCPPNFTHLPAPPSFFFGPSGPGTCAYSPSPPPSSLPLSPQYTTVGRCSDDPEDPSSAPAGEGCRPGDTELGTRPVECCKLSSLWHPPCDRYGYRTVTSCRRDSVPGDQVFDAWSNGACREKAGEGATVATNMVGCGWCGSDGVGAGGGGGGDISGGRCWVPYFAEARGGEEGRGGLVTCRSLDPVTLGQWNAANFLSFGCDVIFLSSEKAGVFSQSTDEL